MNDLFDAARRLAKATRFGLREPNRTGPVFANALAFNLPDKQAPSLEDIADFAPSTPPHPPSLTRPSTSASA